MNSFYWIGSLGDSGKLFKGAEHSQRRVKIGKIQGQGFELSKGAKHSQRKIKIGKILGQGESAEERGLHPESRR